MDKIKQISAYFLLCVFFIIIYEGPEVLAQSTDTSSSTSTTPSSTSSTSTSSTSSTSSSTSTDSTTSTSTSTSPTTSTSTPSTTSSTSSTSTTSTSTPSTTSTTSSTQTPTTTISTTSTSPTTPTTSTDTSSSSTTSSTSSSTTSTSTSTPTTTSTSTTSTTTPTTTSTTSSSTSSSTTTPTTTSTSTSTTSTTIPSCGSAGIFVPKLGKCFLIVKSTSLTTSTGLDTFCKSKGYVCYEPTLKSAEEFRALLNAGVFTTTVMNGAYQLWTGLQYKAALNATGKNPIWNPCTSKPVVLEDVKPHGVNLSKDQGVRFQYTKNPDGSTPLYQYIYYVLDIPTTTQYYTCTKTIP